MCAFVLILLWVTWEAHLERFVGIYSRARSGFNLGFSSPMGILGISFETVTHCLIRFYFSYTPSMQPSRQLNIMTVGFHFVTIDSRSRSGFIVCAFVSVLLRVLWELHLKRQRNFNFCFISLARHRFRVGNGLTHASKLKGLAN